MVNKSIKIGLIIFVALGFYFQVFAFDNVTKVIECRTDEHSGRGHLVKGGEVLACSYKDENCGVIRYFLVDTSDWVLGGEVYDEGIFTLKFTAKEEDWGRFVSEGSKMRGIRASVSVSAGMSGGTYRGPNGSRATLTSAPGDHGGVFTGGIFVGYSKLNIEPITGKKYGELIGINFREDDDDIEENTIPPYCPPKQTKLEVQCQPNPVVDVSSHVTGTLNTLNQAQVN